MKSIKEKYLEQFEPAETKSFTVYSRAELLGNNSDHQRGLVLAATIEPAMRAEAALNGTNFIEIHSEGFGDISVDLSEDQPRARETGTSAALVRGIASRYSDVKGFNAYVVSDIPSGAGLASSAAFGILTASIIEELSDQKKNPTATATNARYAESVYYGKPCGLLDPMTVAYGGIVKIDFEHHIPTVERVDFDLDETGYTLCLIDSGANCENIADYYSEIVDDLSKVSNYFYQDNLSQVDKKQFAMELSGLRKYAGDRAVLRAMHVLNENFRVQQMAEALKQNRFQDYLDGVNRSGESSWMLLQNVIPAGAAEHQDLAFAINTSRFFLSGKGACRLMGGGFEGMLQAYVPNDMLPKFIINMERTLGKGCVMPTRITSYE